MVERKSLIVYFKNDNFVKVIKNINIAYISKKRKYAVIYLDEGRLKGIKTALQRTKGVIEVIDSLSPMETF